MTEHTIATTTHGRYVVIPSARTEPAGLVVGFHGYAESADVQLERLRAIPGSDRWTLVSIQGLHRFYQRRTHEVVASWMTRQDRELAIADNVAYVDGVLDVVSRELTARQLVFAGFSQGVAMAYRAACATRRQVDGVISVGGDVPPELSAHSLARIPRALVCRGLRDEFYADAKFQQDVARVQDSGAVVRALTFDRGHEWSDDVSRTAGVFLHDLLERTP